MNDRERVLEAWIDGRLEGNELREFEERLALDPELAGEVELARRVEASLRRIFANDRATPRRAESVANELRGGGLPRTGVRSHLWGLAACAALAAAWLMVMRVFPQEEPEVLPGSSPEAEPGTQASHAGVAPVRFGRLRPDLEELYCSAEEYATRREWSSCPASGVESPRTGELIADHGESIGLWPDASLELEGPILSDQWPGSMIFAGGGPGELAVLIAERDAVNTCCLDLELPEESGLRLHSWRVGEVLWFEVSPYDQPRFLPRLESELQ